MGRGGGDGRESGVMAGDGNGVISEDTAGSEGGLVNEQHARGWRARRVKAWRKLMKSHIGDVVALAAHNARGGAVRAQRGVAAGAAHE